MLVKLKTSYYIIIIFKQIIFYIVLALGSTAGQDFLYFFFFFISSMECFPGCTNPFLYKPPSAYHKRRKCIMIRSSVRSAVADDNRKVSNQKSKIAR
jgi:hypothetical protein